MTCARGWYKRSVDGDGYFRPYLWFGEGEDRTTVHADLIAETDAAWQLQVNICRGLPLGPTNNQAKLKTFVL